MARDHTTLTIHGLDEDTKLVRAEVLAQKLQALVTGLRAADKFANGHAAHTFIVTEMKVSSALVKVRERRSSKKPVQRSGIETYEAGVKAIYNGDASVGRLPQKLVRSVASLSNGAADRFAHAEIGEGRSIIRIDDFLLKQARRAETVIEEVTQQIRPHYFSGIAQTSLDGVLQLLDSRGNAWLAKITTTAGAKEINCVVNKSSVPDVGQYFDKRVIIQGTAHYDKDSPIPQRIDVVAVKGVKVEPNLIRWRGAFNAETNGGGG